MTIEFWALISAIIVNIVLVTVTIIHISTYRNEIKNRTRPWVGRTGPNSLYLSTLDSEYKEIKMHISNHGSLPAQNMTIKSYVQNTEPAQNIFDNKALTITNSNLIDMLPNEITTCTLKLHDAQYDVAMNKTLYFGIHILYATGGCRSKLDGKYEIHGRWKMGKNIFDRIITK